MATRLDEQVFNKLMLALFDTYEKKLKPTTLEIFMDSYYEELQTMPTEKFVAGIKKAIATVSKSKHDFPTVSKIKELGYGCTDEQRAAHYQEMDKLRVLGVSSIDKKKASQQMENLNLLGKCVALGISQKEIAAQAATGSLRDLIKKYAPCAAMGRKEIETVKSDRRKETLQVISQWRAEGTI
jgi:hypothetical protein